MNTAAPATIVAVSHSTLAGAAEAGSALGADIRAKLDGRTANAVIVFASPAYDYGQLLAAINDACAPALMVGCSSAGEFSGCSTGNASASVLAICSSTMHFTTAVGTGLQAGGDAAVDQLMPAFTASQNTDYPYRAALVLTDALAGFTDELVHTLTVRTQGTYQLFGGGAADDARFHKTHVFHGTSVYADAVVVLEMLSQKPLGVGVRHGWRSNSSAMRVTEAEGNRVISINATPVAEIFATHARETGQQFDPADPLPFFLHNVIGIDTGAGFKLRVPLTLNADGSLSCAAAVPAGSTVRLMTASVDSACDAARDASQAAIDALCGNPVAGSLLFDCAATRLRLGRQFGDELKAVAETLGSENFAGCNTYGQIARTEGQFSGFHNCTAIVCAIPL